MARVGKIKNGSHELLRRCVLAVSLVAGIVLSALEASAAESVQFEVTIALASRSGKGIDSRLAFARGELTGHGYNSATYLRGYPFSLAVGSSKRFSVTERISGVVQLKGVVGPGGQRVQYNLALYDGSSKRVDTIYSISRRGGMGMAVLAQPGGSAYVVLVRALR